MQSDGLLRLTSATGSERSDARSALSLGHVPENGTFVPRAVSDVPQPWVPRATPPDTEPFLWLFILAGVWPSSGERSYCCIAWHIYALLFGVGVFWFVVCRGFWAAADDMHTQKPSVLNMLLACKQIFDALDLVIHYVFLQCRFPSLRDKSIPYCQVWVLIALGILVLAGSYLLGVLDLQNEAAISLMHESIISDSTFMLPRLATMASLLAVTQTHTAQLDDATFEIIGGTAQLSDRYHSLVENLRKTRHEWDSFLLTTFALTFVNLILSIIFCGMRAGDLKLSSVIGTIWCLFFLVGQVVPIAEYNTFVKRAPAATHIAKAVAGDEPQRSRGFALSHFLTHQPLFLRVGGIATFTRERIALIIVSGLGSQLAIYVRRLLF